MPTPNYDGCQYLAVLHTGSDKFATGLVPESTYRYQCNKNSWVKVAVTGGAAARSTANNHFVKAGQEFFFSTKESSMFLHAIAESTVAPAVATLSRLTAG